MKKHCTNVINIVFVLITLLGFVAFFSFSNHAMTNGKYSSNSESVAPRDSSDATFTHTEDTPGRLDDWSKVVCHPRELNDVNDFYEYIYTTRVPCDYQMMLGGHLKYGKLDGNKWICLDKKYKVTTKKCLMFSFGIGKDWSFEDEVERKLGCKIFAFDPFIHKKTHNRTSKISYFNVGISDSDQISKKKIQMKRYSSILSDLGHLNSIIDYLKIDVERKELLIFKDVLFNTPNLLKNVKMIGMEVHISNGTMGEFWKYFQVLECFGFKIMRSDINPVTGGRVVNGRHRTCCYEIVWIQDRDW